jgi:hypothetical protein
MQSWVDQSTERSSKLIGGDSQPNNNTGQAALKVDLLSKTRNTTIWQDTNAVSAIHLYSHPDLEQDIHKTH